MLTLQNASLTSITSPGLLDTAAELPLDTVKSNHFITLTQVGAHHNSSFLPETLNSTQLFNCLHLQDSWDLN